jgi:hypothetical protein
MIGNWFEVPHFNLPVGGSIEHLKAICGLWFLKFTLQELL